MMHARISDYSLDRYAFTAITKNCKKINVKLRQLNTLCNDKLYEFLLFDSIGYLMGSSLTLLNVSIKTITDAAKARAQLTKFIESRYLCVRTEIQKAPNATRYLYASALLDKDEYLYKLSSAICSPSFTLTQQQFNKAMQIDDAFIANEKEEIFTKDFLDKNTFTVFTANKKCITCRLTHSGKVLNLDYYNFALRDEFGYLLADSGDLLERHIFSKDDIAAYVDELKKLITTYSLVRKLEISIDSKEAISYYYTSRLTATTINVDTSYWMDQDPIKISEQDANKFLSYLED